ncbi:hypothetical protein C0J52_25488 [Blattella germanica]|nr:hypothetical protein C0J52_25488 [Blattella germanica]
MFSTFQVDTIIITESKKKLNVIWSEPERLKKSLSGKPKIRVTFCRDKYLHINTTVSFKSDSGLINIYFSNKETIGVSEYLELDPGSYTYTVILKSRNVHTEEIFLELGAVYSLVLVERNKLVVVSSYVH